MSTLILIERTRVLVNEKVSIFKEDLKKSVQTKKMMNERKSGILGMIKLQELEKEKDEKKKLAEKLEQEKEYLMRKVNNLQNSLSTPSPITPIASGTGKFDFYESEKDEELKIDANKIYNKNNRLEEISSDLENISVKSEYSDCTSMTSNRSCSVVQDNRESPIKNLISPSNSSNSIVRKLMEEKNNVNNSAINNHNTSNNSNSSDHKRQYMEFTKIYTKIKFEKLHNSHKGQSIPKEILFKEAMKLGIPVSELGDFILNELKQPHKYAQYMSREKKLKTYKEVLG